MSSSNVSADQEKKIICKITWRIIPFVFLLYIISYLDRSSIGYAALLNDTDSGNDIPDALHDRDRQPSRA